MQGTPAAQLPDPKYLGRHYRPDAGPGIVLLALRPGKMDTHQMVARLAASGRIAHRAVGRAIDDGFVRLDDDGYYHLTDLGARVCPKRKDA